MQLFAPSIIIRKISLFIIGLFILIIAAYGNFKTLKEAFQLGLSMPEIVYAYLGFVTVPFLGYLIFRSILYITKKKTVNILVLFKDILISWLITLIWIGFATAYHWISLGEFMVLVLMALSLYFYLFPKPLIEIKRLKRIIF
ncbi:MAG: hypothetical protein AB7G87_03825 [Clostridia bacterium]